MRGIPSDGREGARSSLEGWECRLSTPRRIATERMAHLGTYVDGCDRELGGRDDIDGGLARVLVSLLEETFKDWSEFFTTASVTSNSRFYKTQEVEALRRTIRLIYTTAQLDPTLGEEIRRAGSQGICSVMIEQIKNCRVIVGEDNLSEEDSDALIDLQDWVFEIYSPSVRGMSFTDDELMSRLPLVYNLTPIIQKCEGEDESIYKETIFMSQVTKRQSAQADVGFVMWPSAIVLSRWLMSNPQVLLGKSVLEIGAGCGLVGITAARIIASHSDHRGAKDRVIISDVNGVVLRNIARNIKLNDVDSIASAAKLDFYSQAGLNAGRWIAGEFDGDGGGERDLADVILAADVICCPEDAAAAARTILDALRPGGLAAVVCADAEHRFGVDRFRGECEGRGLGVQATAVAEIYDGALLDEGMDSACGYVEGMELTLFEITK